MLVLRITCVVLAFVAKTHALIRSFQDLIFDNDGNLADNFLLYHENTCDGGEKLLQAWNGHGYEQRQVSGISDDFVALFAEHETDASCFALCLSRGMPRDHLQYPLSEQFLNGSDINEWLYQCQRMELGVISYKDNPLMLYWLDGDGTRREAGQVLRGERHTLWLQTFLGHRFDVVDSATQQTIDHFVIQHDTFKSYGTPKSRVGERVSISGIENTFIGELARAHKVKRTFTPLGFSKGRLPNDLWTSIQTYHNNNKNRFIDEEWEGKGYFVNWWETTPRMLGMPWGLKRYWQTRLKTLVEEWTGGIPLENTDIYGIRRYEDGARLLTHVDREATHAVSLIINVGQGGMREPWHVEIYDFAGRLHEIPMEPGDIVYYESARCLHGRMKPLEGAYYDNLFSHYRPVGDPEWFTRENPEGTPAQLLDVGECRVGVDGSSVCDGARLPYLSPQLEKVTEPGDLFQYWRKVSPRGGFGSHEEL